MTQRAARIAKLALLAAAVMTTAAGQTTQGLVEGRLVDARSGRPIAHGRVACLEEATGARADAISDENGFYALPLMPPGQYSIRASAPAYQSQEAQEQRLPVAGRLSLDFVLRPLDDVWEAGMYRSVFLPGAKTVVTFYGPDLDASHSGSFEGLRGRQGALETTRSEVIDPLLLENLPLAGRDAYSLLFTLPGVTSDGGVSRGLGLSAGGQRPSSANYLLDGVENNNYLVTGPLTPIPPEAIQEYRVSTGNYSAQYGRTAGFVANAVTRPGSAEWHGAAYLYLRNEALDANTFDRNLRGLGRAHNREFRPGFQVGGPLLRDRLYLSASWERFTGRGRQDPRTVWLPTPALAAALPAGGPGARLLAQYPSPFQGAAGGACTVSAQEGCAAPVVFEPPVSLNQTLGLVRADYVSRGGAHRIMGRYSVARLNRPDFLWSPYKDFTSAFNQPGTGSVIGHQYSITPRLTNEARAAYHTGRTEWGNADSALPALQLTLPSVQSLLSLPGSSPVYPFRNDSRTTELLDNLVWTRGRHVVTAGAGVLLRRLSGFYAPQVNGVYTFGNLTRFWNGTPDLLRVSVDRRNLVVTAPYVLPPITPTRPVFDGRYVNRQYFVFAQDAFRATPRLLLNYGVRYESMGAPHSTGPNRDPLVELGAGANVAERLQTARMNFSGGPAGLLYEPDRSNAAVRMGFSYDLLGAGRTVIRGAYGVFYDRPFDNLWQTVRTNRLSFAQMRFVGAPVDFAQPIAQVLPAFARQFTTSATSVPNLTLFEPNLRNGYVQHTFIGVQRRVTESMAVEVNGVAALGRRLITVDTFGRGAFSEGSLGIPPVQLFTYRGSQGSSNYHALTARWNYRRGRSLFQAAYTWSHAIDNQSDPLGLDLSDFGFSDSRLLPAIPASLVAGFAEPMNSRGDRGDSNFDQRHNLSLLSTFALPSLRGGRFVRTLSRDWTISHVAAIRSGFPFTVWANQGGFFKRAYITDPALTRSDVAGIGGRRLLSPAGFSAPGTAGQPSGRNAFTGPGLYSFDLSVNRSLALRGLPESARLVLRADVFNVLNHANLNPPYPVFGVSSFGLATFGRNGQSSGFPSALPLAESPRQFLLSVRVRF